MSLSFFICAKCLCSFSKPMVRPLCYLQSMPASYSALNFPSKGIRGTYYAILWVAGLWRKPRQYLISVATPRWKSSWTLTIGALQALPSNSMLLLPFSPQPLPLVGDHLPLSQHALLALPVGPLTLPGSGAWNICQPWLQQAHLSSCSHLALWLYQLWDIKFEPWCLHRMVNASP